MSVTLLRAACLFSSAVIIFLSVVIIKQSKLIERVLNNNRSAIDILEKLTAESTKLVTENILLRTLLSRHGISWSEETESNK